MQDKADPRFWLLEIVRWGERLSVHVEGVTREQFVADPSLIDACSWCIGCIGDAAGQALKLGLGVLGDASLVRELRAAYAARNRYVRGYFDLEESRIWDTAITAVPRLAELVRAHLDRGPA